MTFDFYPHVYLSPHMDDAALSCGGLIHRQVSAGQRPLVISLFAGQPPRDVTLSEFAQFQHARWGNAGEAVGARWAEDQAAMAELGADYLRLNYRDCIYRGREHVPEWYYASEEAIFGSVHPAEYGLPAELADALSELIPPGEGGTRHEPFGTLYAPLTVGNHVDHQVTFATALVLKAQGWRVRYYEDYPYVEREGALAAALAARGIQGWRYETVPLDEDDLAAKMRAIARYPSQVGVLFGDAQAMARRVRNYANSVGGERLWGPGED